MSFLLTVKEEIFFLPQSFQNLEFPKEKLEA